VLIPRKESNAMKTNITTATALPSAVLEPVLGPMGKAFEEELPSPRFAFFSVDSGDLVNATLVLSTVLRPEGFRTDLAASYRVARRGDKLRGAPVRISRILRPDILRPTTVIAQEVCVAALHQAGRLNPARGEKPWMMRARSWYPDRHCSAKW
jgi:hypothetical protein